MDFLQRLSQANRQRCPEFGHGQIEDWSKEKWGLAVAGEVGELCNFIKKDIRGDKLDMMDIGREMADILIYLDMVAQKYGFDLEAITTIKFNETSRKIGSKVKL